MRRIILAGLTVIILLLCVLSAAPAADSSDAVAFKPAVPPGPTSDTFKFVVMADAQPRDENDQVTTPQEFFRTIDEVNAAAPAFSVICGDLLYGYTDDAALLGKMWDSFLDAVQKLDQPLFCVIGNHDVSEAMHDAYFIKRFGDIRWYSFDYGPAHFVVLDSEEVGNVGHLTDPQLEWLKADLEKSQEQRHKFVFLHKPFAHFGEQWDKVIHPLLAEHGVTAVFAGHWHSYRFERELDGIRYYVLPACGGADTDDEFAGIVRGFMEVTVGPEGVDYALNFRGKLLPDDYLTAAQIAAVWALRNGQALTRFELPSLDAEAGMKGTARVDVTNSTPYTVQYDLSLEMSDAAQIEPIGTAAGTLAPDATATHQFRVTCPPSDETHPFPQAVVKGGYVVAFPHMTGRLASRTMKAAAFAVPAELPTESETDRYAQFDGKTAAVEIPFFEGLNVTGPFTIEAWFNVEEVQGWLVGGLAHTEASSYALLLADQETPEPRFYIWDPKAGAYAEAKAEEATPLGRWVHIACTSDGKKMALWIDGKKAAEADAPTETTTNSLPMYIGADPAGPEPGHPHAFLKGCVDEFRFSTVCRYAEEFTPARRFEPDEDTLILYHLDRVFVNRIVDYSGNGHHGVLLGDAVLVER